MIVSLRADARERLRYTRVRHLNEQIQLLDQIEMSNTKSYLAILMGIIIIIADVYWLYVGNSYQYTPWLVAGIVIFVASIIWIGLDFSLMKK